MCGRQQVVKNVNLKNIERITNYTLYQFPNQGVSFLQLGNYRQLFSK